MATPADLACSGMFLLIRRKNQSRGWVSKPSSDFCPAKSGLENDCQADTNAGMVGVVQIRDIAVVVDVARIVDTPTDRPSIIAKPEAAVEEAETTAPSIARTDGKSVTATEVATTETLIEVASVIVLPCFSRSMAT